MGSLSFLNPKLILIQKQDVGIEVKRLDERDVRRMLKDLGAGERRIEESIVLKSGT
jgi:hypothetical protein